ncbi:MAG: dihydroorotase [Deferribacteraceae bacterium]|jgi:dihydroorotase|nr:dihydroorotase [Deferribacteraceae bacterium]
MRIALKNGTVVTDKLSVCNLIIDNGKITEITDEVPQTDKEIDCSGKIIVPGLIDMHTHLREPGQEYKETLLSGSEAAVAGGVTTLCCMANANPVTDDSALAAWIVKRGKEIGLADILPYACVTKGMAGKELTEMGILLQSGVCGFSDDGKPIISGEVMRRALEYSKYFGSYIACHEEEPTLSDKGVMHEGAVSANCGLRGIPTEAESVMIARDIELARLTGGRAHICHVSGSRSVELIRRGKADGINITSEVTPNHLTLTDKACADYDTASKVNPPLRAETDRQTLIAALKDGVIDCVASDHAPHHKDDKFMEYDHAAFGMLGLQLLIPLLTAQIHAGAYNWVDFARFTSENPAKILGLTNKGRLNKGFDADITVIDPVTEYIYDEKVNRSKSVNTPFWGKTLKGRAVLTIKNGKTVFEI